MYFRTTEQKSGGANIMRFGLCRGLPVTTAAAAQNRKHAAPSPSSPLQSSSVSSKCERRKLEFYQKSPNFRSVPPSRSTRAANDLQHPSLHSLSLYPGFQRQKALVLAREGEGLQAQGGTLELPLSPKMGIALTFSGKPPSLPPLPLPSRLTWLATPEEV